MILESGLFQILWGDLLISYYIHKNFKIRQKKAVDIQIVIWYNCNSENG